MSLKNLPLVINVFLLISLAACKHDEYDYAFYAKKYCDCLTRNRKKKDFFEARSICDGELLLNNRFFRADYIENNYGRYLFFMPKGLVDSTVIFSRGFYRYIEKNCCKVAIQGCDKEDSLQIRRKLIDTIK